MSSVKIDWNELTILAEKLSQSGVSPGSVPQTEWAKIETALNTLEADQDWNNIIRLRRIFRALIARDSVTVFPLFKRLSQQAINAAELTNNKAELAHLLGAEGHNLHRQGYHQAAITAFERSSDLYREIGEPFEALKNYYMTALCHRALDNRADAKTVLTTVIRQVETDSLWRANPLQVMAWLAQDEGDLAQAEQILREALQLYRQNPASDIQVAGALADLGEVVGLQKRTAQAQTIFNESLNILQQHAGQYDRQEARTKLKLAELMLRKNDLMEALRLLNQADDKIRVYGHYYDLMWRIETLRAFIFLRQGQRRHTLRKMRMALFYRRKLGLSNWLFVKQLIRRLFLGIGLPR